MIKNHNSLLERFEKLKMEVNNVNKKPRKVLVLGSGAH